MNCKENMVSACCTYPVKYNKTENMNSKKYMPLQSLGPQLYTYIYNIVVVNVNKHIASGTVMQKCIAKEEFNVIVNECMCELTKHEKSYKELLNSRATGYEEETRAFCQNCNGLLKSVVEVALITSLLNGGCAFCY